MSNKKCVLRGENIYESELKKIAKANHVVFDPDTERLIRLLETIPDDVFLRVEPEIQKVEGTARAVILAHIKKRNESPTSREISEETGIPIKVVTNTLTVEFNAGNVLRALDAKRILRYMLDGGISETVQNQSEMKTEKVKKAKVEKVKKVKVEKVKKEKAERVLTDIQQAKVSEILAKNCPKSGKMKGLINAGLTVAETARALNTNYSYVYNYINGAYEK